MSSGIPTYILPSGKAHFFDTAQSYINNSGSGINSVYPSPSGFSEFSGVYKTYGPNAGLGELDTSGIFQFNHNSGIFSSGLIVHSGISTIFNPYIHYYAAIGLGSVRIPYVSSYTVSSGYNPYKINLPVNG